MRMLISRIQRRGATDGFTAMTTPSTVTIVASDDKEFTIEAYHLQASSKVFRDMMSGSSVHKDDKPILVEGSSRAVGLFLNLMRQDTQTSVTTPLDQKVLAEVVDMLEKYDCPAAQTYISLRLCASDTGIAPWRMFVIASKVGSPKLATDTIRRFTIADFDYAGQGNDAKTFWAEEIDHRYSRALVRAAMRVVGNIIIPAGHSTSLPINPKSSLPHRVPPDPNTRA